MARCIVCGNSRSRTSTLVTLTPQAPKTEDHATLVLLHDFHRRGDQEQTHDDEDANYDREGGHGESSFSCFRAHKNRLSCSRPSRFRNSLHPTYQRAMSRVELR